MSILFKHVINIYLSKKKKKKREIKEKTKELNVLYITNKKKEVRGVYTSVDFSFLDIKSHSMLAAVNFT